MKAQETTGVGRNTVLETRNLRGPETVQKQPAAPQTQTFEVELPPSGANGLAPVAPQGQQGGSATSLLEARTQTEAPHRRGRTSALKVASADQIKREMGLNARKNMRQVLDRCVELKAGYDKFGGVQ